MEDIAMMTIKKPKYKKTALTQEELHIQVGEMRMKYEGLYPKFNVNISIEPDPNNIKFDGRVKEFNCQAVIEAF
jgi:hypothetical protein